MRIRLQFSVILLLLVNFPTAAEVTPESRSVSEIQLSPAQFRLDQFSIIDNTPFPPGSEDVGVIVRCIVGVERNGRIRNGHFFCIGGNSETAKYEQRVLVAMQNSKMKAATVNGKKTHATMRFSVVFERVNGVEQTRFFSNHLVNMEHFGTNYIAPQLIHHSARFNTPHCALNLIARVSIDALGNVATANVEQGEGSDRCKRNVLNRVKKWQFIPGFVNGKPVAMDHLLYFRWLRGWI